MEDTVLLVNVIIDLYQKAHYQLREEISSCEAEILNWTLGPDTNSIGNLIVHILSSEEEMLLSLHKMQNNRHRDNEFIFQVYERDKLFSLIDAADANLKRLGLSLTANNLHNLCARPNKEQAQLGLFWLIRNYGHVREHLAHIQLTKQVYLLSH